MISLTNINHTTY